MLYQPDAFLNIVGSNLMPRAPSPAAGFALPAAPHLNLEYRRALARLRKEAEDEIERLIDILDRIAPDPDLEDDEREVDEDFEPSLGWAHNRMTQVGQCFGVDDLEDEFDGREPDDQDSGVEDEPHDESDGGRELDLAENAQ